MSAGLVGGQWNDEGPAWNHALHAGDSACAHVGRGEDVAVSTFQSFTPSSETAGTFGSVAVPGVHCDQRHLAR